MNSNLYQIQNIFKRYGKKDILKDVSFSIPEKSIVGLVGLNGSGKTTLSSIVSGLKPCTSGDVLLNGKTAYKNIDEYKRTIGLCPQRTNLDNRFTVRENLINDAVFFGISDERININLKKVIKKFNLEKYLDFKPAALSGGYKQRVSIARALMHEASLIILDEPTLGLDPNTRKSLWDVVKNLKEEGCSVLITTHYMDEIEGLIDKLCILSKGKIFFDGTVDELKKNKNSDLDKIFNKLAEEECE
ncbi:ABC transporter ATP-binding protein [Candidatus Nesciobacter abundans]|uniref:ABC transporter ATP-binding protein n=1 Tax=Candidatus Nesciobacter abundans TaxID=2601668 RepID=A0A5C0UG70_9PROT|nr:ABC transporter ATP-binding protein [Candidatus Nesciobacter abundans]QEK39095.1 ABC transporter ATP-binding protein [Candidatus Nesciobacter abundans]